MHISAEQVPVISIVLPMRNAAGTIDECLNSVFAQTFLRYEVIVVDDGSSDDSAAKVEAWRKKDRRIRLFRQPALGLVAALNRGIHLAKGQFIARMDADDIMHESRLQLQLDYLLYHRSVDLVATQVELIASESVKAGYKEYIRWQNNCLSARDMRDEIYIESPIAHPTVMIRREAFASIGVYRQGDFPEDYDLWLRMLNKGMQIAKIPKVLLKWREYASRTSRVDRRYNRVKFDQLRARYLRQDRRINSNRPLLFWGAGRKTRKRIALSGLKPTLWIDVDHRKIGNTYLGAKVVSPECLRTFKHLSQKPFVLSYVTNHGARELIASGLHACGFARGDDYLMVG